MAEWTYPSTTEEVSRYGDTAEHLSWCVACLVAMVQVCRYAVYKDLWGRGYTITTAVKYGGDFLVYDGRQDTEEGGREGGRWCTDYCVSMSLWIFFCAGDPALVHSHFIALVLPWKQPITTLVTLCRLGSKVVKAILLCSVTEDGNVHYQTVQWTR